MGLRGQWEEVRGNVKWDVTKWVAVALFAGLVVLRRWFLTFPYTVRILGVAVFLLATSSVLVWLFLNARRFHFGQPSGRLPELPRSSTAEPFTSSGASLLASAASSGITSDDEVLDVTPEYLVTLFEQQTTIQAQKLAEAYVGKRIIVYGPLGDAQPFGTFIQVTFRDRPGVHFIYMYFDAIWADRLAVLRRGDIITVTGRIKEIEPAAVHLESCALSKPRTSKMAL